MTFRTGIDCLLADGNRLTELKKARVGLVAHPASITGANQHALDALFAAGCPIDTAFGPQHGMRGDKQDNMIESGDYLDPQHGIPVISLYGDVRRPTDAMLQDLDIILFDLQDVGCRIYTYITTLYYLCEACARLGKDLWVLDRPNPAGRPVDGLYLEEGEQSFVGCAPMPTRHGLTIAELACWFSSRIENDVPLTTIAMANYDPTVGPGFGWPLYQHPWINPSPNAASHNMTRFFPGTVLLEGTTLSEGRGTTVPLEVMGAPDLPIEDLINDLTDCVPHWLEGAFIRQCFFSPTFHKHVGELCRGLQVHTDHPGYQHDVFKPYRLIAGLLKAIKRNNPDFELWRHHDYEYEPGRIPIDVINGGPGLRRWVDDDTRQYADFEQALIVAETQWLEERQPHLIYP